MRSPGFTRTRFGLHPPRNPLAAIHRGGAALLGVALLIFGVLGLVNQLTFIGTEGSQVMGLSSNGLLSVISVVVGVILIGAALKGGFIASTVMGMIGILFLLSGLLNLAVLRTDLNILAFRIENVVFSLVVGILLLIVGSYGRVSGGLAEDNPFRRARAHKHGVLDPTDDELEAERAEFESLTPIARAEIAVGDGRATAEQEAMVEQDHRKLLAAERARAWHHIEE